MRERLDRSEGGGHALLGCMGLWVLLGLALLLVVPGWSHPAVMGTALGLTFLVAQVAETWWQPQGHGFHMIPLATPLVFVGAMTACGAALHRWTQFDDLSILAIALVAGIGSGTAAAWAIRSRRTS